ncbi:hypothetical protein D3C81_1971100 [compost metagenome]
MRAAGVALLVGDDGKAHQRLQAERPARLHLRQQRMAMRHDDAVRPAVARQGGQACIACERLGGHADIGSAAQEHLGHLAG